MPGSFEMRMRVRRTWLAVLGLRVLYYLARLRVISPEKAVGLGERWCAWALRFEVLG